MKRILLLPKNVTGIIDVRKQNYYILDSVNYLEEITNYLLKNGKRITDFKFCQFEPNDIIPFFVNVKDKLSNSQFQEFEIEKVKFRDMPDTEENKKAYIEARHLTPLQQQMQQIVYQTNYIVAMEKLGEEIKEDDLIQLGLKKDKIKEEMSKFKYQDFYDEIV